VAVSNRREAHRLKHVAEGLFKIKAGGNPDCCLVKGCRNAAVLPKSSLCHRHFQIRWRNKDPKKSAFRALKDHALERNIPFDLTPCYFAGLTDAFAYYDHEAESRGQVLTIDRVFADRGYTEGNCRVITHSQNASKLHKEKFLPEVVQAMLQRKRNEVKHKFEELERRMAGNSDCPF
jgi:hypothetical protein